MCRQVCGECYLPVCSGCSALLQQGKQPPCALANDLWTGYMPRIIYSQRPKVTLMEMLCASGVHPAMMHVMYTCLGEDMFREPASGPKQKLGAKGNITAFMIQWEKIFSMLKGLESTDTVLPRCGSALSEIIVVTLKYYGSNEKDMKQLLSECTVRRDVVLSLIQTMVDRGHRAYKSVDMAAVRAHAELHLVPNSSGMEPTVPDEVMVAIEARAPETEGKAAVPPQPLRKGV